ncbi:MAG: hypothetical protein MJE12_09815 [Alphaproteobacteria bacterium]|nr:hypothetical protein [Alphaproteobacteria bacterium]
MKNNLLHRYWIKFEFGADDERPPGFGFSCGVTAYTLDDALEIIKTQAFNGKDLPKIGTLIEDVDVSTLDRGRIRPNMGIVIDRGIWFPQGYEFL